VPHPKVAHFATLGWGFSPKYGPNLPYSQAE
jgi:hypothetical protein